MLLATNPPDAALLLPGDRVVTKYKLIQAGTWLVNYQVAKIERAFEDDGRFTLRGYVYDPEALTVALDVKVNPTLGPSRERPAEIQHAGLGGNLIIGAILGIIGTAVVAFVYEADKKVEHYREIIQHVEDHPELPPSIKEEIGEMKRELPETGSGLMDVAKETANTVGLVALAVLAWLILGRRG